tara:strand:+ start:816 stop:1064 length:249 start_codon:yes stop_codon:yes gene_type:complete
MAYLFFDATPNRKFDTNGNGAEGTLGEHLSYLERTGGTPECMDSTDTSSRQAALTKAESTGQHLYVVDEDNYRVVGEVNKPD